jgi:hypothetical protein
MFIDWFQIHIVESWVKIQILEPALSESSVKNLGTGTDIVDSSVKDSVAGTNIVDSSLKGSVAGIDIVDSSVKKL